jgi:transcriptional regulator with XRE-family HTH domain
MANAAVGVDEARVAGMTRGVESVSHALGLRIRAERRRVGLTVRALAARIGASPSLISQVERGRARPSVATLWAIATELGLPIADLFSGAEGSPAPVFPMAESTSAVPDLPTPTVGSTITGPVQPHETRQAITLAGGVRWERLTSDTDDVVDFVYVVYPVGAESCGEDALVRHGGREYGYVLSGTLGVTVGFDTYTVRQNDSISFESTLPHRLWTIGDTPVHAIWSVINRRGDPRARS